MRLKLIILFSLFTVLVNAHAGNLDKDISAGFTHNLLIKSDGTLWARGFNGGGQLGDGTTRNRLSPLQIDTDNNWELITGSLYHSTGIHTNGELCATGVNNYGSLANGTTTNSNVYDCAAAIVLPVSLLNFSGHCVNENAFLSWQTSSEQTTAYFTIEHSTGGVQFSILANVPAAGYSGTIKSYSCLQQVFIQLS